MGIEIERGVVEVELAVPKKEHQKDLRNHLQLMQVVVMLVTVAVAVAVAGSLHYRNMQA